MVNQQRAASVILAALIVVTVLHPLAANIDNPPPPQPGFPQDLIGGRPYLGLPTQATIARMDNTHLDNEIVLATPDRTGNQLVCTGHVYVYNGDGTLRWSSPLPQAPGMGPSVADLNGDGVNDVVVGYGEFSEYCDFGGGVRAFDGRDGTVLWDFTTTPSVVDGGVYSTPAIGDVDGDGHPEVVFGSRDYCVYMLDHAGQSLWHFTDGRCNNQGYYTGGAVDSSPALADLEGDGKLEIVIGTHYSDSKGYLNILRSDSTIIAQWPIDAQLFSSPAISDLNNDGVLEIAFGTGSTTGVNGRYVQVMHYDPTQNSVKTRLVHNWFGITNYYVSASPAIGDINNDGILDVVAVAPNGTTTGSSVFAWRGSDGKLLFERKLCDVAGKRYYLRDSPVIADVVGDAAPEIVLTQGSEVVILNADGAYYTDQPTNACLGQPSTTRVTYWTTGTLNFIPAIGALDQSGNNAMIVAGAVNTDTLSNYGRLFAWAGHNSGYAPWPQFHHDAAHTGLLDNIPPNNPLNVSTLLMTNTLSASWGLTITWGVSGSDIGAGLAGYAVVWDHRPATTPGTQVDVRAGASTITSTLGSGTWYAHVRAVDRAGNGAKDTLHFGPFLLYLDAKDAHITFMPHVVRR